jgi:DNA-binding NarL/FixJ family response regulator
MSTVGGIADAATRRAGLLIAHEHTLFRAAVRAGLERNSDLVVVGQAASAGQAIAEVDRLRPHVAVVDSDLPPTGGVDACTAIKGLDVPTRVLIMCQDGNHRLLLQGLEAGADGYVRHEGGLSELVAGCEALARGEAFVPSRLLAPLLKGLIVRRREEDVISQRVERLSRREREVFELLVSGHDQQRIAKELIISPATARTHLQNVLRKLEVHSRLEATALALTHDLFPTFAPKGVFGA